MARHLVRSLDPNIPIFGMRSMEAQAELTLVRERMVAGLTGAFSLLATILSAIGIYGLMSFTVSRRTREIAVRIALGAKFGTVKWLVMREVLALVTLGGAVAIPAAWALTSLVRSQLYGVAPNDAWSLLAAALSLAVVALLAAYLPVRRAARVDPMSALRCE